MNSHSINQRLLFLIMACACAGCGKGDGLVKHQVTGAVHVNGLPEKGIVLTFHHTDPSVQGNAARPTAVTDDEGRFQLSTNGVSDGAIAGDYVVTFFWTDGGTGMVDFLRGKYCRQETSEYRISIGNEDSDVEPFELEAPAEDVDAAHTALRAKLPPS